MNAENNDVAVAVPTKQFFVSMLTRDISLADAILDLVDNCLDGALRLANGDADEPGDLEDQREAPLHEPGAEFASATGRVEPEDDALDEIDTTNNQSLVPSSMGFTFCVASDVDELTVEARWGRYERVPNDEHDIVKRRTNRRTGREEERWSYYFDQLAA